MCLSFKLAAALSLKRNGCSLTEQCKIIRESGREKRKNRQAAKRGKLGATNYKLLLKLYTELEMSPKCI